jgi:hypothetical protein
MRKYKVITIARRSNTDTTDVLEQYLNAGWEIDSITPGQYSESRCVGQDSTVFYAVWLVVLSQLIVDSVTNNEQLQQKS